VQDAIDARDIAKLYEYWCLFNLAQELKRICGKAIFKFNFTTEGALSEGKIVAEFADGSKLAYNRRFTQGESYSGEAKPDFTLDSSDGSLVVFDAKCSFENGTDNRAVDQASRDTHTIKTSHLDKMHTYKDKLRRARAAIALFPSDNDEYFSEIQGEPVPTSFADLVKSNWRGVGAKGMMPTQRSGR
jgi:predicted component of viral defense system (DUF524 family)